MKRRVRGERMNEKLVDCGVRENYTRGYKTLSVNIWVDRIGFSKEREAIKKKGQCWEFITKENEESGFSHELDWFILPIFFGDIIHWFDRPGNGDFIYLNVFQTRVLSGWHTPTVADFSAISNRITSWGSWWDGCSIPAGTTVLTSSYSCPKCYVKYPQRILATAGSIIAVST